jgi:lauroyl/myristoyl acyltransferase
MAKPLRAEPVAPAGGANGLVSLKDLAFAAALPVLCATAWLAPARFQKRLASSIAKIAARLAPAKAQTERRRFVSSFADQDAASFYEEVRALANHETLNLLKLGSPFGAKPRVDLVGREHLDRALAKGSGAILWVAPTTYGPMMTKVALAQAGIPLWHLSRPSHGFSNTSFGRAFLNPIRVRAEGRCLAGRIVIRDGDVRAALAELTDRLQQNRPVSITLGVEGRTLLQTPFLSGTMTAPARPVQLARQNGAPLLPVVTVGRPDGYFVTEIGAPLIAPDADRSDIEAMQELAQFLTPHARTYPAQFAKSAVFSPIAETIG